MEHFTDIPVNHEQLKSGHVLLSFISNTHSWMNVVPDRSNKLHGISIGEIRERQNLFSFSSVAGSRQTAGQQKTNMAAQQGTIDNTVDTLYKNLQEIHQMMVYEL